MNFSTIAKPLSRNKIRNLASEIRGFFEIPPNKPIPIVEMLEGLSVDGELLNFEIVPDDKLPECYAKTLPDQNLILIKESVYYGACDDNPRDRFTIAHEIGHYMLHSGDTISFARSDEKIKAYQNPEWQANTFAAELLVPVDEIANKSAYEISKTYNVSHKVAEIQLKFVN